MAPEHQISPAHSAEASDPGDRSTPSSAAKAKHGSKHNRNAKKKNKKGADREGNAGREKRSLDSYGAREEHYRPSPILDDFSAVSEGHRGKMDRKFYEQELSKIGRAHV